MNTISDSHLSRHKRSRLNDAFALSCDYYYFMQTAARQAPAGERSCSLAVLSGCKLHQRCMKNSALSLRNIRPTYCQHTHTYTHTQWHSHMHHSSIHVAHTCEREVKENTHYGAAGEQLARHNEQWRVGRRPRIDRLLPRRRPQNPTSGKVKKCRLSPIAADCGRALQDKSLCRRLPGCSGKKEGVRLRGASGPTPQLARLFSSDANDG